MMFNGEARFVCLLKKPTQFLIEICEKNYTVQFVTAWHGILEKSMNISSWIEERAQERIYGGYARKTHPRTMFTYPKARITPHHQCSFPNTCR